MYPVVVFGPVVEPELPGAFLCKHPEQVYKDGQAARVPWITGFNSDEGAINIATLFLQNSTLQQLNSDWDKFGPIFLDLKNSGNNYVESAKSIRNFYLGNNPITFENRKNVIKVAIF